MEFCECTGSCHVKNGVLGRFYSYIIFTRTADTHSFLADPYIVSKKGYYDVLMRKNQCCRAGAGTFWSEPEPVQSSGSATLEKTIIIIIQCCVILFFILVYSNYPIMLYL